MKMLLKKRFVAMLSLALTVCIIFSAGSLGTYGEKITAARLGLKDYNLSLEILQEYMRDVRETRDDYLYDAGVTCFLEEDFYYVALGDETAAGESYVDLFAKDVGIDYKNLAVANDSVENICNIIDKNSAEIEKANLVSIGYGSNKFMTDAINQFLANKSPTYDWSKYVDKTTETALVDGLATMKDAVAESGLDGSAIGVKDLPGALTSAVEAYLYSCILYMYYLPDAIAKIHKINPEATIAVIGVYNPTKGITFDLGENMSLNMNDYLDRLTDILAAYIINSCDLPENGIYIHSPDVKFKLTDTSLDMLDLMREFARNQGANLVPSADGHKYIKDQMLKYIDFTDKLFGDADGNKVIDSTDAQLILQYYSRMLTSDKLDLSVCDVNGDKVINNVDAMLVLQYSAKIINKLPIK